MLPVYRVNAGAFRTLAEAFAANVRSESNPVPGAPEPTWLRQRRRYGRVPTSSSP